MSQTAAQDTEQSAAHYDPPPALDAAIAAVPLVEASKMPRRIGYLTNYSFHIWYQIVIEVMTRRASQYDIEIDIADAGLSVENQIAQARAIVDKVDAIVLTPANTAGLEEVLQIAAAAGKPVVVEANPVKGMRTLVAICDYDAGFDLGVWIGKNVVRSNGEPLRILDVGLPWLRPCLLRSEGFFDGVRSVQADAFVVASIDGEATPAIARRIARQTLAETGEVDVIFAMDDETAQGAFQGFTDAGFNPSAVSVAGFGLSGVHEKDWMMRREALKVSAAMFPEYVGLRCADGVVKLFDGQAVPLRDVIPTLPMTAEILERYYPRRDGIWTPDFEAIKSIPVASECTRV
jgi:ribose transport system substrate-binding protein